MSEYNIVLASVPYTYIEVPPLAPAVLRGALEHEGLTAKTVDIGFELYKESADRARFDYLQDYFITSEVDYSKEDVDYLHNFIDRWANQLLSYSAEYIGISVFSFYAHYFTYKLCQRIRELDPNKKIVIGGNGAATETSTILGSRITLKAIDHMRSFGEYLKANKLCDVVIIGDGELALIALLKGQTTTAVDKHIIDYKNEFPFANFDDYELNLYPGQLNRGYPQIPIFGSKGCVRNCDFCDVYAIQGKFRFRAGGNIFKEMLYLADRYGIRDFNFTDSLVNGSLSNFEEWVGVLAEYNNSNPDKRITWNGSWICRPTGQMSHHMYKLIAESGCVSLSCGVESGSDYVLEKASKKTNIQSLLNEIDQFDKNGIKFISLFIIGHWDERWEDFIKTCDLLYKFMPYARNESLIGINLGMTGMLLNNTPADLDPNKKIIKKDMRIWWNAENPSLTMKERVFRLLLAVRIAKQFKIPLLENSYPATYSYVKNSKEIADQFYGELTKGQTLLNTAESAYFNYEEFVKGIVTQNSIKQHMTLAVEFETSVVNENPKILIKLDESVIFDNEVFAGITKYEFNLDVDTTKSNRLSITFYNKSDRDTIISNGDIVNDKFVLIRKLIVDDVDVISDTDFYYNQFKYIERDLDVQVKSGFWINNSTLYIDFTHPFMYFYSGKSNKNTVYGSKMITPTTMPVFYYDTTEAQYEAQIAELLQQLSC